MPVVLVFGTLNNLINIGIFARRPLRTHACSWYFICLSVTHILLLDFVCVNQIVTTLINYNMSAHVLAFCKIRQYMFDLIVVLSRHFLCLISIDRWIVTSSNASIRKQSSPRVARLVIISSIVFWSLVTLHSMIGFEINDRLCSPPLTSTYYLFYSIYNIFISILPMVVMIVFSTLTLCNVRSRKNSADSFDQSIQSERNISGSCTCKTTSRKSR